MNSRRILQSVAAVALLAASFGSAAGVEAWSGCGGQVTVNWGDTLQSIAAACGTTVDAIRNANPGMTWVLAPGQVLYIPGPGSYPPPTGGTYVVQRGDTLGNIAMRYGVWLRDLIAVNPQIWNPDRIYPGQVIYLPAYSYATPKPYTYTPRPYPTYYQPTPRPAPTLAPGYAWLRVTYAKGLIVRTGPGLNYPEIVSPYVGALKDTYWQYRIDSMTTDAIQFVWVEVRLSSLVQGYSTGWILARDGLGKYFTDPQIGPPLDPNDP